MANNKMLIDCSHPEETRVVVTKGNKVEEFDFESASRKQLRGNIYLAKVTRVEPSLQAAFVDYGGNRHGFLAFSEIHPDYYQIPVADRQALLEAEAAAMEDDDEGDDEADAPAGPDTDTDAANASDDAEDTVENAQAADSSAEDTDPAPEAQAAASDAVADDAEDVDSDDVNAADDTDDEAPSGPAQAARRKSDEQVSAEVGSVDGENGEPASDAEASADSAPAAADGEAAEEKKPAPKKRTRRRKKAADPEPAAEEATAEQAETAETAPGEDVQADSDGTASDESNSDDEESSPKPRRRRRGQRGRRGGQKAKAADTDNAQDDEDGEDQAVEDVGAEDVLEEVSERRKPRPRQYKIQEVIKRRQVLLVQVVKEERGNKGAALTTYLSLAGRYSVLMPNTARGGGISRKITNVADRKRLKSIASQLDVPAGMGVILRTAGAARTETEITRDFDYLSRVWETIRDRTLKSSAPTLVHEEGSLIKRSIRDLYSKDISEIQVAGDAGYEEARDFMQMLMPEQAEQVKSYRDDTPFFGKFGIESQLDALFSPDVTLKSGGYIVINQTEALVSIDVNSGRSTREHSIEDTALQTNLEAAEEVARQLRLRDLAGLVVIDFIDMEEKKNNRAVERKLKDCLKVDRARIQLGRISHFGLLEMSRQRLRTGMLEGSTAPCPNCHGTGMIRSTDSVALHVLRGIEDFLQKGKNNNITVRTKASVALYILNQKRQHLADLESRLGIEVTIDVDETLGHEMFAIDRGEPISQDKRDQRSAREAAQSDNGERGEEEKSGRRKRKRRRRNKSDTPVDTAESGSDSSEQVAEQAAEAAQDGEAEAPVQQDGDETPAETKPKRSRGRRRSKKSDNAEAVSSDDSATAEAPAADSPAPAEADGEATEPKQDDAPPLQLQEDRQDNGDTAEAPAPEPTPEPAPVAAPIVSSEPVVVSTNGNGEKAAPKRTGWWRRG